MKRILRKTLGAAAAIQRVRNWPTMLLDHTHLLPKGPVSYRFRSGEVLQARANTYDVNAIEEVWLSCVYTPPGFEIGPSETVVDIGAHIGAFTVYAARRAGRVFAFEPTEENFGHLATNIKSNALTNVTAIRAAVSGASGTRQMFILKDDYMGSLYPLEHGDRQTTVESTTLERFFAEHGIDRIHFLKLDCEGSEFDILLNAPDTLLAKLDKISMEVHPSGSHNPEDLRRFLVSKGFDVIAKGEQIYATRRRP
jgi:FkbM family methyltransferase